MDPPSHILQSVSVPARQTACHGQQAWLEIHVLFLLLTFNAVGGKRIKFVGKLKCPFLKCCHKENVEILFNFSNLEMT